MVARPLRGRVTMGVSVIQADYNVLSERHIVLHPHPPRRLRQRQRRLHLHRRRRHRHDAFIKPRRLPLTPPSLLQENSRSWQDNAGIAAIALAVSLVRS